MKNMINNLADLFSKCPIISIETHTYTDTDTHIPTQPLDLMTSQSHILFSILYAIL